MSLHIKLKQFAAVSDTETMKSTLLLPISQVLHSLHGVIYMKLEDLLPYLFYH